MLTLNDFEFIITAISDTSQKIMQNTKSKQATMFDRIEIELIGVQQAIQSIRAVSIAPPPSKEPELGDELAQINRIADTTKAHLC
jgi:hypothetical protein